MILEAKVMCNAQNSWSFVNWELLFIQNDRKVQLRFISLHLKS